MEELPEVKEALRRLPEEEQYLRLFRIKRALDLSLKHAQLPKEQWTKPEEVHCTCVSSSGHACVWYQQGVSIRDIYMQPLLITCLFGGEKVVAQATVKGAQPSDVNNVGELKGSSL